MMAASTDAAKRDTKHTKTEPALAKKQKNRYKYCIVPECKNTTVSAPEKLFFSVPTGELRESWCEAMGRRQPAHQPLSPTCNRFCCQDHFDLEKDMENYIQWKLMGREGISKLLLKKGVVPHKFDCLHEKIKAKQTEVTLDQRLVKVKKHRVNILNRQITEKVKAKQYLKAQKLPSEEENILEQRKKIAKISRATQTTEEMQEQEIEAYRFHIKIKAEDSYEPSNGDSVFGELFPQGIAGGDNSHLLGVNVKVEESDEKFEPELVDCKQEIITEDEAVTIATEIIPVLMEISTPCINVTNSLIEPTSDKGGDFKPVVKEETQEVVGKTANSLNEIKYFRNN